MKSLNSYICESKNREWRYFDAFQNKAVSGTDEDLKLYQDKFRQESPKHWGPAPKASDPENLLQGAVRTWGSERTKEDLIVAFDKNHPDYHFDSCKAIVAVEKNGDYEQWKAFHDKYPIDNYYVITGCVRDIKDAGSTITVFDMYLS